MLNKQREWIKEKVNYEEKKETYKKVGIGAAIGVGALALLGIGMKLGLRKNPPKIGTRITYRYWGLTDDGKPRFPVFDRLHSDL